jgi:hypothetical protein
VSPFSAPVLGGAALLTSPSLLNVLEGVSPVSVALTRFLISMGFCWMALEVLSMVVGPAPRPQTADADTETPERAEEPAPK